MRWSITSILCVLLLSGCVGGVEPTPGLSPVAGGPAGTTAPVAVEATPTAQLPEGSPAITTTAVIVPPVFLYVHGNTVFEQGAGADPIPLVELPDAGAVLAAATAEGAVLVLRELGIQRIRLTDNASELIHSFDEPATFGVLVPAMNGARVIYQAVIDDPQAAFGYTTRLGLYEAESDAVQPLPSPGEASEYSTLEPLGLGGDGTELFVLPRGQDPAFERLFVIDLGSGERVDELPVRGEGAAALAPNGRRLITTERTSEGADGAPANALSLYDMAERPPAKREVSLPHAPSHARGLVWSPDGRFVYFGLLPGDLYDSPGTSYGIWRLDAESGELSQVVEESRPENQPVATSPDGQWLLLRSVDEDLAELVNLPVGTSQPLPLPATAIVAGWR